jgi:hypothetical protein
VPEAVVADVEARIAELVEAHRPELQLLVDQALERELAQLVAQRLNGHANGNGTGPAQAVEPPAPEGMRTCAVCGRTRPLGKFDRGKRKVCTTCRSRAHTARVRAREHLPGPEPESRPAIPADELAARTRRFGALDAAALASWLTGAGLAVETAGGLVPTGLAVELGGCLEQA